MTIATHCLADIPVVACEYIEGVDNAVLLDGKLHVSERLEAEIRHADPDELNAVLSSIKVLNLGRSPWLADWPVDFVNKPYEQEPFSFRSYLR